MKTTNTKKIVAASANTPAASAPVAVPETLRVYENAIVRRFGYRDTDAGRKTVVVFETADGRFYTALVHPAIRWADKIGVKQTLVVKPDKPAWRLLLKPTAEEEAAYAKASAPAPKAYSEAKVSKADLAFLASF
jgi:hypothetical protein